MNYARILSEFHSRIWALPEELLLRMADLLRAQSAGAKWSDEEIRDRIANANAGSGYQEREHFDLRYSALDPARSSGGRRGRSGKVGVIPITGIISHRMTLVSEISGAGATSIQKLQSQFRACLRDVDCTAIVFDVDSPGGSVDGVVELASEILEARRQKPIIAVCNSLAASAAYWLASAASEVVCTNSGQCGSIGVYMVLADESEALKKEGIKVKIIKAGKYKAEGHPAEPLTDDACEFLQSQVNSMYVMFVNAVSQQRGVSQSAVRDGMGQGRALLARDAVRAGLADRVGTLDEVLWKLGVAGAGRPGMGMPAASRDARVLGDFAQAPESSATSLSRRRLELELMRMGEGAGVPTTMEEVIRRRKLQKNLAQPPETPEDGALARRRRQMWLLTQR